MGRSTPGETSIPEHEPPVRGRYDMVYLLDATGSTGATLPMLRRKILDQLVLLGHLGSSVRVGVIAFRGGHTRHAQGT